MRSKIYGAAMVSILAVVVALVFASGPVMAASTEGAAQPTTGATSVQQKTNETKAPMQGEMREHMKGMMREQMQGKMPEHMKGQMMREEKTGQSAEQKTKFSGEAKAPAAGETKAGVSAPAGQQSSGLPKSEFAPYRVAGGQGVVARVDRPDNCLRIRSGPSTSDSVIGCAAQGTPLNLTGVFSRDGRWAQLDDNGWIFFSQVQTSVKPPASVASHEWKGPAGSGFQNRGRTYWPYGYGYHYGWPYYYYGSPYHYGRSGYCW